MEEFFYYSISSCTESGVTHNIDTLNYELTVDSVYYIVFNGDILPGCFTVTEEFSGNPGSSINIFSSDLYTDCVSCTTSPENPPPVSAGTPYYVCVVCPDGTSGYTYTSVEPPHPVASNNQGDRSIIQMGAVVIGGPNGLNS